MKIPKNKGVTLVELLISIVVISLAFVSLVNVLSLVTNKTADSKTMITATNLAQAKMEEWMAKGYSGVGNPNGLPIWYGFRIARGWTCFDKNAEFGNPDNHLDYDGQFGNYYYSVYVYYVSMTGDPIEVIEPPIPDYEGNYLKLVRVYVDKGTDHTINAEFRIIMSGLLGPEF